MTELPVQIGRYQIEGLLARNIENPSERAQFLREARSQLEMRGRGSASTRSGLRRTISANPTAISFSPVELERIERELARFVGPIAKVFVGREVAKARSLPELWDAVALHIESGAERAAFLRTRES